MKDKIMIFTLFYLFLQDNYLESFPYGEDDFLKMFFGRVGVRVCWAVIASNKSMKKLLEK